MADAGDGVGGRGRGGTCRGRDGRLGMRHFAGPAAGREFLPGADPSSPVAVTGAAGSVPGDTLMDPIDLRADCARCAALCCVALAFDRSPLFALDKPAGRPCPNLGRGGRCRIHRELGARGFGGCVAFDCHGAGQRVTCELFAGRSWMEDGALLEPMSRAFIALLEAHECLLLLTLAERLDLGPAERGRLAELRAEIGGAGAQAELIGALHGEVRRFLAGLQAQAGAGLRPAG